MENRLTMKIFVITFFWIMASQVSAQDCDCLTHFSFVKTYFEQNNPAFQKIKHDRQLYQAYLKKTKKISEDIKREKPVEMCPLYFDRYIELLKDHHSGIGYNLVRTNLNTQGALDSFKNALSYKEYKKIAIDTAKLLAVLSGKKQAEIEGVYTNGGSVVFGIIKKENTENEYQGVILRRTKLLDVGQVILDLKYLQDNNYECHYHIGLLGFNIHHIVKTENIVNGYINDFGFYKSAVEKGTSKSPYEFKVLNDSTNYLRLSSFDAALTENLNHFYESIAKDIESKPNLVIDIRNNGGGSERSYFNLIPYIYTRPLTIDSVEVWVSPENIKRYEEAGMGNNNTTLIARMKSAKPYTFIPQIEGSVEKWEMDSITRYPKKIALVYNRGTASAAEGLITYCMQSDKVITIGENSGGYIGYGDVMVKQIPCSQFTIRSTTTRYHANSKYEFVGITPKYKAKPGEDWVAYACSLLTK